MKTRFILKAETRDKDKTLDANLLGAAGELRIVSELLRRSIRCYRPYADQGVDIVTEGGIKIQAKTARIGETLSYYKNGKPRHRYLSFAFQIKKATAIDFCIVWLPEPDVFYILPSDIAKRKGTNQTFRIYTEGKKDTLFTPYRDAWHLIKG